jgi:hypothetical protein
MYAHISALCIEPSETGRPQPQDQFRVLLSYVGSTRRFAMRQPHAPRGAVARIVLGLHQVVVLKMLTVLVNK